MPTSELFAKHSSLEIEIKLAEVAAAITASDAKRKSDARHLALAVLEGHALPKDPNVLDLVLTELQGIRVIAQLRELDATINASPSLVSDLKSNWNARLSEFNELLRERDAAMNDPRLPAKAVEWDARVTEIQLRLDAQQIRVNEARFACSREMSRNSEAKDRRDRLRREHQHLFTQENAA